ncbi:MAG: sigma factor-like helix-turn-helix DNA-binding protein [Chryseolinea sp.]
MKAEPSPGTEAKQLRHYQSLLFPFAYNITGDLMASEDIVQEVITHHMTRPVEHVENPEGYLVRSVVNKAINQKKLLRNRMEQYPGHWLPSPVLTEESMYKGADRDSIIHYSLLVLMERLNAKERAVFILKETFDYVHEEIADILKITVDHSRQLLKRGKEKISIPKASTSSQREESKILLSQLADAIKSADLEKAKKLLSDDVSCIADGGPNISATRNVLEGPDHVSKLLKAIYGKYFPENATSSFAIVNHMPALVFKLNSSVFRCVIFEIEANIIQKIFVMVNPDKLKKIDLF